jgi:hypothetical protein
MVCLVLVGLSIGAGAFVVHTVSAALFRDSQGQLRSGSTVSIPAQQSSLKLQSRLVDQRSEAVAEYAVQFTEFKTATARPPGAVGINLTAREVRRRDDVLTGLVLECINAVDRYNLGATALSATQLRSAGLPERYTWAVDCAPGK